MKSLPHISRRWMLAGAAATLAALLPSAQATTTSTDTWTGASDSTWGGSNWSPLTPGSVSTSASTDIAQFNTDPGTGNGSASSPLIVDAGRNIFGITFTTSAGNFVIGTNAGNSLQLSSGGTITVAAALTGTNITETIAAPLVLEGATTGTAGIYTISNLSTLTNNSLLITGNISGGTTSSTVTLTLGGATTGTGNNVVSGNISDGGAAGGLALNTGGRWTLTGNNTFTGGVTVGGSNAVLNINSNTAVGTGTLTFSNGAIVDNTSGSTVTLTNNNAIVNKGTTTFNGTNSLNLGTGTFDVGTSRSMVVANGTGILTIGGNLTDTGYLMKVGAGTLVLNGSIQYTSATSTSLGSGAVAGGTLVVNGNNSAYAGGFNVGIGTLDIGSATALGTGTLFFSNTANGGVIDNTTGGNLTLSTNPTQTWNSFTFTGTNNLDMGTGAVTMAAATTVTVNANTLTVDGAVGGAFKLTKAGAGTLTLTGTNTYNGGTAVTAGTLNLNGGNTAVANALTVSGGTLNLNVSNTGVVSVTGGAMVIGSTATSTGAASVTGGNLVVNGTNSGTATIKATTGNTALLTGTGTITGTTAIGGGAGTSIVDAGTTTTIGSMTVGGNLSFSSNSVLQFEINSTTKTFDTINVTGTLALGTAAVFSGTDLGNTLMTGSSTFVLATSSTGITGTFAGYANGADITIGNNIYQINYGTLAGYTNDLTLTFVAAVPEPSTYVLLGMGGLLLFVVARRQRRLVRVG